VVRQPEPPRRAVPRRACRHLHPRSGSGTCWSCSPATWTASRRSSRPPTARSAPIPCTTSRPSRPGTAARSSCWVTPPMPPRPTPGRARRWRWRTRSSSPVPPRHPRGGRRLGDLRTTAPRARREGGRLLPPDRPVQDDQQPIGGVDQRPGAAVRAQALRQPQAHAWLYTYHVDWGRQGRLNASGGRGSG
jgi:hypothetical protein